ncbi:hypothetical protein B4U80_12053, partial [Leptotrombidium deliense]
MMLIREQTLFHEYIRELVKEVDHEQVFIFVTGEAGTGKSHLLMNVVNQLEDADFNSTLVVAYTGYAALN